ncbi:hypothetical protein EU524_02205 [Candidatus Thorarchaeota archaeon]|nr:MAG: hypothetical protein EU524_02205 [Candidatus Thorarchaeota archaeon]
MLSESEYGMSLPVPPNVKVEDIMMFLQRGHGYSWLVVAKTPVSMVLGRTSRTELPDLVILNEIVYSSKSSETLRERFGAMLDHLERQATGGA